MFHSSTLVVAPKTLQTFMILLLLFTNNTEKDTFVPPRKSEGQSLSPMLNPQMSVRQKIRLHLTSVCLASF